jgi:cobalt/nickel transport protein
MAMNRSIWLIGATVALIAAPLLIPGLQGEFKGSDDLGTKAIVAAQPGYQPWAQPLWTPPSKEIESLLFALQAALGAGFLGYVIGRRQASRDNVAGR